MTREPLRFVPPAPEATPALDLILRVTPSPSGREITLFAGRVAIGRYSLRALVNAVTDLKDGETTAAIVNHSNEQMEGRAHG